MYVYKENMELGTDRNKHAGKVITALKGFASANGYTLDISDLAVMSLGARAMYDYMTEGHHNES